MILYFHSDKKNDKFSITPRSSQGNDFLNLTSSRTNEKEKEIKNNFNKKIPELGKIIHIRDYEGLISEKIRLKISKNKLNYKKYLQKELITYNSFPIQFKNENVYYGNWNQNNEMEGYGIYYINEQKVVTEGIWIKGNIIFGRIFFPNGKIYEGEIKNSVPHGKGKMCFDYRESYEGDFAMGEMTGNGTFIFADKTVYNGGMRNGLFNGKGKMKWNNGIEYDGNFLDSTFSGKGKIFNVQGEEYEGNFDKNEFNGEGIYSFNNGDEYKGNFEYGIKKGRGVYKRNDKIIFEGNWDDDLPNGNGVIYHNNNKIRGFWRNGNLIGNPEIEKDNLKNLNNMNLNIRPSKANLIPNSLPHIQINDMNISQFTQNNELNFV